jgi:hypothetical protein
MPEQPKSDTSNPLDLYPDLDSGKAWVAMLFGPEALEAELKDRSRLSQTSSESKIETPRMPLSAPEARVSQVSFWHRLKRGLRHRNGTVLTRSRGL